MPDGWSFLIELIAILGGAFLVGAILEQFRQSAILGYILAGVLLGPGALGVIQNQKVVQQLAEVGVALLLFTIGLEFSFQQLRRLGKVAVVGGTLQVGLTLLVTAAMARSLGLEGPAALATGAVVALSSTAIVLRVLYERGDIDAGHGKSSLAILLFQDVALVALVLMVTLLGKTAGAGGGAKSGWILVAGTVVFVGVFAVLLPRAMRWRPLTRNRELPVLLAVVLCMGATWGAHEMGLSPALGAFLAGVMLAETPFAGQIRADIAPLRVLFVALFFASVGMLADLRWIGGNLIQVGGLAAALIMGKALVVYVVLRILKQPTIASLAAGIALAQIGEFSFVLIQTGLAGGVFSPDLGQLLTSASIVTILLCPTLVSSAPRIARALAIRLRPVRRLADEERRAARTVQSGHVLVAGFGEAGRAAVRRLIDGGLELRILDLDHDLIERAQRKRIPATLGDATSSEILREAGIERAAGLLVAVPDFVTSRLIVQQARHLAPELPIVVRGRYNLFNKQLEPSGASEVIDEERETGGLLANTMFDRLAVPRPTHARSLAEESPEVV